MNLLFTVEVTFTTGSGLAIVGYAPHPDTPLPVLTVSKIDLGLPKNIKSPLSGLPGDMREIGKPH